MARRYYSTTAQRTTLASSCTDSATTIVVTAATGFPSSTPFPLVLDADTVNEEAVLVTSRVGTTCTVTRAYDGTTGVAHSAGATVRHAALALDFNEASEHVNETTTAHGLTLADVITTTNTKTLTNKTLTAPTIADFTNAAHDHGDADDGGLLPASSVLNRPINDQSGSGGSAYTFALADARKHVLASGGSTKTFTIPLQAAVTWLADAKIIVTNTGAGVLTIAITATGTLNGSDLTLAQGESAALLRTASDVWWCLPFSSASGAVPRGTISGTTGSPSTSANGGATAYKWTSSGSFTVDVAGLFTGLVVGGGGGGGGQAGGGGGGGGQVLALTDFYLAAGTYNTVVAAGGAGGADGVAGSVGGTSFLGGFSAVGGGGGGKAAAGGHGASGGGGSGAFSSGASMGSGLGYAGGAGSASGYTGGGGGGGNSAVGSAAGSNLGGNGGAGTASSITGSSVTYGSGGGGGTNNSSTASTPGTNAGAGGTIPSVNGVAATANFGGGGGGGGNTGGTGGAGGSGVVILLVGTV